MQVGRGTRKSTRRVRPRRADGFVFTAADLAAGPAGMYALGEIRPARPRAGRERRSGGVIPGPARIPPGSSVAHNLARGSACLPK